MRLITYTYEGKYAFVHNTPIWVCNDDKCPEQVFDLDVFGKLMKAQRYAKRNCIMHIDYNDIDEAIAR